MNIKTWVGALLFLFMFFSCDSVDELQSQINVNNAIRLTDIVIPQTRGVNLQEQSCYISKNQLVGITINGASRNHNNIVWIAGEEGELRSTDEPLFFKENNRIFVTAYHPYNADWNNIVSERYNFKVCTDQTGIGYLNSDLLWAESYVDPTNTPINLTFNHILSKINVILLNEYNPLAELADIYICNTYLNAEFEKGVVQGTNMGRDEITAGQSTKQASAVVIPQTIKANTKLIKVNIGGDTYYYTPPKDIELESGKSYTYKFKLDKDNGLKIEESIVDWIDFEESGTLIKEDSSLDSQMSDMIIVDKNGNGDYYNLEDALKSMRSFQERPVNIFVRNGEYEMREYHPEDRIYASDRNIRIIGEDKDSCILYNKRGLYTFSPQYTDNAVLKLSGNVLIQNFTIISSSDNYVEDGIPNSYCIHCDYDVRQNACLEINNCKMINDHGSCLGIGLRDNYTIKVKNCELYTNNLSSDIGFMGWYGWSGAIVCHDGQGIGINQRLIVENCVLQSSDSRVVTISSAYKNTIYATFKNNVIYPENSNNSLCINNNIITEDSKGNSDNKFNYKIDPTNYTFNLNLIGSEYIYDVDTNESLHIKVTNLKNPAWLSLSFFDKDGKLVDYKQNTYIEPSGVMEYTTGKNLDLHSIKFKTPNTTEFKVEIKTI